MEEGLLLPRGKEEEEEEQRKESWGLFFEEVKRLGCLAGPMVAVLLSQYMVQVVSMMMVGHLGELALSSTALSISFSGVTGFSLLVSPSSTPLNFLFVFFISGSLIVCVIID